MKPALETTLSLLTRSGAITVRFEPGLQPEQYDELLKAMRKVDDTQASMETALRDLGQRWDRQVTIDLC